MLNTIVLLGSKGYIGETFQKYFSKNNINFIPISREICDLLDKEKLFNLIKQLKPSLVINCAGYTGYPNVDGCEINKQECLYKNYNIPKNISIISNDLNIKWIHVSSGCIYNGDNNGKGFTEEDEPNFSFYSLPCSYYSGVKAEAEKLLNNDKNVYICRLRIPFNKFEHRKNYITKLLTYNKILNAINSLSHTDEFVEGCYHLFESGSNTGIYNITNDGSIETRFVANLINKYISDKDFIFFENEKEFYSTTAKTPRSNCVLDNTKLLKTGYKIRHIEEAIEDSIKNYTLG